MFESWRHRFAFAMAKMRKPKRPTFLWCHFFSRGGAGIIKFEGFPINSALFGLVRPLWWFQSFCCFIFLTNGYFVASFSLNLGETNPT